MQRHHRRLRRVQRRYYRKGRRKAPPDRPPGGNEKLRLPRTPLRTYNFNTFPPTGAAITNSKYTLYLLTTIHALFDRSLPRIIKNKNYLRQQRKLYYKPIGLRYTHILPKHTAKLHHTTSIEAQLLSDQIHHQLSDYISPTIIDVDNLPPDPSHWHSNQSAAIPTTFPPSYQPFYPSTLQHRVAAHTLLATTARTLQKKSTSGVCKTRHQSSTNSTVTHHLRFFPFLMGLLLITNFSPHRSPSPTKSAHHHTYSTINISTASESTPRNLSDITNPTHDVTSSTHDVIELATSTDDVNPFLSSTSDRKDTSAITQPQTLWPTSSFFSKEQHHHTQTSVIYAFQQVLSFIMPSESQEGAANSPETVRMATSHESSDDDDMISAGDINPEPTQKTNNTTASKPKSPASAPQPPVDPSMMAFLQQFQQDLFKQFRAEQNIILQKINNIEQGNHSAPSMASTASSTHVPTSINSPSTHTTGTTMHSTPFQPAQPTKAPASTHATTMHQTHYQAHPSTNTTTQQSNQSHPATTTPTATSTTDSATQPSYAAATKPSSAKHHQSGSQTNDWTTMSTSNMPINFCPELEEEMDNFDTDVTIKATIDTDIFGNLITLHREELKNINIPVTLQECFNRVLLLQFPQDHPLFGQLICTNVKAADGDSYHITFDIAQSDTPFTSGLIAQCHAALLEAIQNLSIETAMSIGDRSRPRVQCERWIQQGYHVLFAAVKLEQTAFLNATTPILTALVSNDLQARAFNQMDRKAQNNIIKEIVAGFAKIDSTGSFSLLRDMEPIILKHITVRGLSYPNPNYKPKQPKGKKQRTPTQSENLNNTFFEPRRLEVTVIVTSDTPLGRKIAKALNRLAWNRSTSTPNDIHISNSQDPLHFRYLPADETQRKTIIHNIRINQPNNTIHLVTGLPPNFHYINGIHSAYLQDHPEVQGINACFMHGGDQTTAGTAAHVSMGMSLLARNMTKHLIQQELLNIYEAKTNNAFEDPTTSPTNQQLNQNPTQPINTNPLDINPLYGNSRHLWREQHMWYGVFWGKGGYYITVTQNYSEAMGRVFEVSYNHHKQFSSLADLFAALSEIHGQDISCFEDINIINFRASLFMSNLDTHLAPTGIPHLQGRNRINDKQKAAYYLLPTSHEELAHRFNSSSNAERKRYMTLLHYRTQPPCVKNILARIEANPHPFSTNDISNMILDHIKPTDEFTFAEYSVIEDIVKSQQQPKPNGDDASASPSKPESLDINDEDMSMSSLHNDSNQDDNQEFYVSSQEQQAQPPQPHRADHEDSPKKRAKRNSTPAEIHVKHLPMDYIRKHWCLITSVHPFTSTQDLKTTMCKSGLYYDDPEVSMCTPLSSVHLCQHMELSDDNIPTHAVWICNSEHGYNEVKRHLTQHGVLDSYIPNYAERLHCTDPFKILPLNDDLEEPGAIGQMWKQNCPEGQELALYNLIKTKDHAGFRQWYTLYYGKQAHSL